MATYTEMVDMVLDWSNRDTEVLSYANIKKFIAYGVDDSYRNLRIAPMEQTLNYTAITQAQEDAETNTLLIPSDAIEFIQLYLRDTDDEGKREVYEPKTDLRSFYDEYIDNYASRFYTRDRNNLVLFPGFSAGDRYALHYYRRFPDVDARYAITAANNTAGLLYTASTKAALMEAVQAAEESTVFSRDPDLEESILENPAGFATGFYLGRLTGNWLRDQNEKVILYGALKEAFDYLNEMEQANKYREKFISEIEELNREDKGRMVKGGSIQVHFRSNGLI